MALTVDWVNRIVHSDASITDFPVARSALRALEETEFGVVNPRIFDYAKIALGGGAWMYDITLVHGYTLQFPSGGGPYEIKGGNFNGTINPTGVQVVVTRAAAYAVTALGGSAPTAEQNAAAVLAAAQVTPIHSDARRMNGATINGTGIANDQWRGA